MKTFASLKSRLEALPAIREGRQHEANYAGFLAKGVPAAEKLVTALNASAHAASVLPSADYHEASKKIRSAGRSASGLRKKLEAEPAAVAASGTEKSFILLFENAADALKISQSAWETELQNKVKDWEAIQDVVAKLIPAQGGRLRKAIRALQTAKDALPQTKEAAAQVKVDLEELRDSVAKLDLQGPFGEFLRATASPEGADLHLLNDDVAKVIASHQLQKVFRVRVSS